MKRSKLTIAALKCWEINRGKRSFMDPDTVALIMIIITFSILFSLCIACVYIAHKRGWIGDEQPPGNPTVSHKSFLFIFSNGHRIHPEPGSDYNVRRSVVHPWHTNISSAPSRRFHEARSYHFYPTAAKRQRAHRLRRAWTMQRRGRSARLLLLYGR